MNVLSFSSFILAESLKKAFTFVSQEVIYNITSYSLAYNIVVPGHAGLHTRWRQFSKHARESVMQVLYLCCLR